VDVWHCDALGSYLDVSGAGQSNTTGQKFLRGYQVTGREIEPRQAEFPVSQEGGPSADNNSTKPEE
jgi:hypothetical protein